MTELLNLPFITEGVERSTFHYDTPEFNLLISEVGKRFPDNEKVDYIEIVSSRCEDLLNEFLKTMGDYSSFLNTYLTMYSTADDTNPRTKVVRDETGRILSIEFSSFSKDTFETKTTLPESSKTIMSGSTSDVSPNLGLTFNYDFWWFTEMIDEVKMKLSLSKIDRLTYSQFCSATAQQVVLRYENDYLNTLNKKYRKLFFVHYFYQDFPGIEAKIFNIKRNESGELVELSFPFDTEKENSENKLEKASYNSYFAFVDEQTNQSLTCVNIRLPSNYLFQEEVKLLTPQAIAPVRSTTYAACKDLFTPVDIDIPPGSRQLIKTGVAIAWNDPDYYMQLLPRSSIAYKSWTDVKAGVIDYDYRKEIGVILHNNHPTNHFVAKAGDRIAQYAYVKITFDLSYVVDEFTLPLLSNRVGGFGSTNV